MKKMEKNNENGQREPRSSCLANVYFEYENLMFLQNGRCDRRWTPRSTPDPSERGLRMMYQKSRPHIARIPSKKVDPWRVTRVYFRYENLMFLLRSLMRRTQRHDQKKNEKRDRKPCGVDGRGDPRPGGTLEVGLKIFDPEFDPLRSYTG